MVVIKIMINKLTTYKLKLFRDKNNQNKKLKIIDRLARVFKYLK